MTCPNCGRETCPTLAPDSRSSPAIYDKCALDCMTAQRDAARAEAEQARESNRKLNRRCQEMESLTATFRWCLEGVESCYRLPAPKGYEGHYAANWLRKQIEAALRDAADARAALDELIEHIHRVVPCVTATIGHGGRLVDKPKPDWIAIHEGRANSSVRQLDNLEAAAKAHARRRAGTGNEGSNG